ncbi:MAG: hypothetical protein QM426_08470 [Euryarchaeota archaeon]|nr:hypothetical protein [Euryarchaeota archaeon]
MYQPDSYAFKALEDSNLKGYGIIRKCWGDYKIGPLFSGDLDTAEKIFRALKLQFLKKPFTLMFRSQMRKQCE